MCEKPIVTCELIGLVHAQGHGPDVFVAHLRRTSSHPRLGEDRKGAVTVTSRVLAVDFKTHCIETMNTYYIYA